MYETREGLNTESACSFEYQCPVSSSGEKGRPCFEIMKDQPEFLRGPGCEVNTFAGLALQNYWEFLSEPLEDEERDLDSKRTVLLRSQRTTLQLSFNQ